MDVDRDKLRALAGFRSGLRKFLAFSETAAAGAGITNLQYQAMLAIKASDRPVSPGGLAKELLIRANATVQMIDRLEALDLVVRTPSAADRRSVHLTLTDKGDTLLMRLASLHLDQLAKRKKQFADILRQLKRTQSD
jgi:DNA-binding MarR family transcriptional regulator